MDYSALSNTDIDRLLKGITIPPRPDLLVGLEAELQQDSPDLIRVADLVAKDVGTSALVLKTLNSPLFALRQKVSNLRQAVQLLGLRNVRSLVTGLMLRNALGGGRRLDRFWESAERVASINAYLCSLLPKMPREEAYAFGLFHDCGIPVLMERFDDYIETLKQSGASDRLVTEIEEERHATNHTVIAYMLARSWGLSPLICDAILNHHNLDLLFDDSGTQPQTATLVALNALGEHLNDAAMRMRQDRQWEKYGERALEFLGISPLELDEITEEVLDLCSQGAAVA